MALHHQLSAQIVEVAEAGDTRYPQFQVRGECRDCEGWRDLAGKPMLGTGGVADRFGAGDGASFCPRPRWRSSKRTARVHVAMAMFWRRVCRKACQSGCFDEQVDGRLLVQQR